MKRFQKIAYLAFVSLFIYFFLRIYIYYSSSVNFVNAFFGLILLMAESHSIVQSLGFLTRIINIKKGSSAYYHRKALDQNDLPPVTILVPGRNEPLDVLESTFICLKSLQYTNKKIIFLDGSDENLIEANRKLVVKYDFNHFIPREKVGSKAEIINKILPEINSKYLVIFDADQNPLPNFLSELVPLMEYSDKVAFVQTPQLYTNINVSPIAKGAALQQSIFFENICEGKGATNSMFCCGTNFIMRTNVLKEVGGFDASSVTEDFATSVKIHALGYKSIYYKHVSVFGMAPEDLSAYFKQQYRWSGGTVGVIRKLTSALYNKEIKLTTSQKWEYFLSATYYFTGWSFLILILCPALYLLFNIPSYFANPYFYLISFVPYYVLTLITFYSTMKKRHYKVKDVFIGTIMSSLSFPILIQSTLAALLNKKMRFEVTNKGQGKSLPLIYLWPWILVIIINLAAIIVGIFRYPENHYAIGINIFWCTYHLILLLSIFKLNQEPKNKEKNILKYA
jgi:cellulose synthase (UDP-forming)